MLYSIYSVEIDIKFWFINKPIFQTAESEFNLPKFV